MNQPGFVQLEISDFENPLTEQTNIALFTIGGINTHQTIHITMAQ
jgi:hypothetical protein